MLKYLFICALCDTWMWWVVVKCEKLEICPISEAASIKIFYLGITQFLCVNTHAYHVSTDCLFMVGLMQPIIQILTSHGHGSRVKKRKIPIIGLQIFGYTSQSTLRIQNMKMVSETNFGHSTVVLSPLYVRKVVFSKSPSCPILKF